MMISKEYTETKIIYRIGAIKITLPKKYRLLYKNPHSLLIETSAACNNSCSFCWRSHKKEQIKLLKEKLNNNLTMDFKLYKKIIDEAISYDSLRWLCLGGPLGEPLLNPNIADFFEYANKRKHFHWICINTNGLAIHKHNIEKLLNNITDFSISVDSINQNTYKMIHGVDKLPQVVNNIKTLIEYKKNNQCLAKIVVRFTENEINKGEFDEFKKFFFDLGVDEINYTQLHGFAGVHKNLKNEVTAQNCQQIYGAININPNGDITTCCCNWKIEPTFGNLRKQKIWDIWNNKKMQDWLKNRLTTEPCKDCSGIGSDVQHSTKIQKEH